MSPTLIDELLSEQRTLTPVARFAREHDRRDHALAGTYRDLIPLSAPGPGEQYAFEVDLDKCTGCKACVAACHSLNGLDDQESWREVGRLQGHANGQAVVQTVTTACHHCADPGCAHGCPVLAYEKDSVTGVVRHLDDQCIGCQYCIMKCPYEVPKYSDRLGIVRKCDMCHGRLAAGEAPACVQACPTSAIAIRVIRTSTARARAAEGVFLPHTPDPRITIPTTRYVSTKPLAESLRAADHAAPTVQPGHGPLVIMLVFTQTGLGLLIAATFQASPLAWLIAAVVLIHLGLAASILHLGQPLKAWRAFLGWRTSWLSREIIALGTFLAASTATLGLEVALPFSPAPTPPWVVPAALTAAIVTGILGVFCSAMVYHDTHRQVWRGSRTFLRFFGTTALFALPAALPALLILKLAWEARMISLQNSDAQSPTLTDRQRSALLLRGPLRRWTLARFLIGAMAIPLFFLSLPAALLLALLGELIERWLYFKSGVATKMPGS
ncbi:MAG: DmsC/YnfH family molybdoenzyme membrane anchor subunit [Verrucomicrobiia bacterium]